ncbi:MAG: hypothetical protein ABL879_10055 [Devosia sp.]
MNATFYQILGNNLVANITNFTVWFAITFWVYLETKSVFATGMIAGIYLILTASFGIWFGSLVDHNAKKRVMLGSSLVSLSFYAISLGVLAGAPEPVMRDVASPWLWGFILRHVRRDCGQHPLYRVADTGDRADPRGCAR